MKKVRAELECEGAIPAPVPDGHSRKYAGLAVQPFSPVLPVMPDLSAGRCSSPGVSPGWWSSHNQEERQAAIWACRSCPVLAACREWSLSLPSADTSIYGGLTAADRIRARRERDRAAAAEAEAARLAALRGMPKINATKITCKHGHDISPGSPNVRIDTGGRGKPMRVCLTCKRIRKRLARRRDQPAAA